MSLASYNVPSLCNESDSKRIDAGESFAIYDELVVKCELYQRPLYDALLYIASIFGAYHKGCAITLKSGKKYMIHKFAKDKQPDQADVVVAAWENIDTKIWKMVEQKSVSKSTVKDYVKVCGTTYKLYEDDCRHAAQRMFKLN